MAARTTFLISTARALAAALVVSAAALATAGAAQAQTVSYDLTTTSVMKINLPVSQAVTVVVSSPVGKIVSADPGIADAQPITDRSIYVVGKAFGTTTVNLYAADGTPVGREEAYWREAEQLVRQGR